ncbi:DsbA family oxidoreductase [Falsirhodobacter algicola]|uniref:DsbA family oxidoreductase n=1 Tax=Falsirhodobacter algicola TaxID=2692330 RepID=A0A8J8MRM5_9RHOB|nr:DsbA family oxidoreductase [Falsirhodobacter algicola]QUS35465.1 DsbA family oxidoreductase [Falsirhodobacter algicola]
MRTPSVPLDIFFDPVCPWCHIGKALLDRALETRPAHPLVVTWHPFRLNPDIPPEGAERATWLEVKFGDRRTAAEAMARVQTAADQNNVVMDLGRAERVPDTIDAHRLTHWAGLEGRQSHVVDALFRAYFRDGLDIGDADVLTGIAASCGMDADMTARLLKGDADRDDLMARDLDAREKGVTAVPTFLLDRQFVLTGVQSTEMWQNVIDEIIEQLESQE